MNQHLPDTSNHATSARILVDAAMETQSNMEKLVEDFLKKNIPSNYANGQEFTIPIISYMEYLGLTWSREELFQIDSTGKGEEYNLIKFCIEELSKMLRKLLIGANWPYNSIFDNKEGVINACYITEGNIKTFGASGAPYIGMSDYTYSNKTRTPSRKELLKALISSKESQELRVINPYTRATKLGEITLKKQKK